jgi:nitrogen fixation/metabolism regulation signal transduction histidine kinase
MPTTTTTPPAKNGAHKRSVRNYLLDSHFQLKYTGFIVLVAVAISAVMGAVLYSTTRAMFEESAKVVEQSEKVSEESQKVSDVSRMNVKDLASDSPELLAEFNKEAAEHDKTIAAQHGALTANQAMLVSRQEVVIWSLVGGLALMVVLIGMLGIYFTHKVAGPVYKMKRLLKHVGDGNLRVEARLRKGDELQDFFDAFTQMVAGLRDMERKQLDELEKAIAALERGSNADASASITRLRDAMKATLAE